MISELFSSFDNINLIDKYEVYQKFADCWGNIESDLIRIRTEGKGICRGMEEDIVLKKDSTTHKVEEVVVGMKGSIFPLDLIKSSYFEQEFDKVKDFESKISEAQSTYTDVYENLDDTIQNIIANEKDKSKIDSKKLKATINSKNLDQEIMEQLRLIFKSIEEEKACKKKVKEIVKELDDTAKLKLTNLTDSEIDELLTKKWIEPVVIGINGISDSVITNFYGELQSLKNKYDNPMDDLAQKEDTVISDLNRLLNELTGTSTEMTAIQMLMKEL